MNRTGRMGGPVAIIYYRPAPCLAVSGAVKNGPPSAAGTRPVRDAGAGHQKYNQVAEYTTPYQALAPQRKNPPQGAN